MLELDSLGEFTTEDFNNCALLLNWNQSRWDSLRADGWIEIYRHRDGKHARYDLWKLSRKSKNVINKCYSILSGSEVIPPEIFAKKSGCANNRIQKYLNNKTH